METINEGFIVFHGFTPFIYLACVKSLNFAGNPPLKKRDCKEIARYVSIKVFPL